MDVVVTQAWGRVAYNAVRSLARHGLRVGVGTDRFLGMACFSRYTSANFQHASFMVRPKEFVQSIKGAIQRYEPAVYMPVDQESLVIARYRNEFKGMAVEIPIAPFETLRTLHKKDEAIKLARSLGIPTPETIVPRSAADILEFSNEFGSPVVVKKLSSSGARDVFYLDQESLSLMRQGQSPVEKLTFGSFLVQQYVRGTGFGVSMLFNAGKIRAKFTHKRLREKCHTGGISTLRTGVVNSALEEYAQRLLESVNFHGVAMVEFKFDEQTKKGWLLEVNPRFWGSLGLAIQSGVDFPYLLYRIASEGDVSPVTEHKTGLNVRWILGDLMALVAQLKFPGARSSRKRTPWLAHGHDDLYWDDPVPFLSEGILSVLKYFKMGNLEAQEGDICLDPLEACPSPALTECG